MFNIPLLSYFFYNFIVITLCYGVKQTRFSHEQTHNPMRRIVLIYLFFIFNLFPSFNQTEGWSSVCAANTPSVSEVMVDACGNEFQSEYVILRNGNQPFDISRFALKVINPTNNAFVGEVTIGKDNLNNEALQILTAAAGAVCPYGTVFRNVFSPPYNGVVPENATILFFANKDSTDVAYLSPNTLASLCGSKVFVAFGSLRPQSRGASIFRNYPQNGSCGAGGCLRQIQCQFEGVNAPFCTQLTYDIKKLPHLNTTNPPAGFNEGSYIRPDARGNILYGGGNLTGRGVCMPPDSLNCVIPAQPDYGDGFWNVSVFEGFNNFTNFKGFYQAKGNHKPSETASSGSFEYNTARDGWKSHESPSEAHPTYGALRAFDGCNVWADSFSILAKRRGFPCGNYDLKLVKYDDFVRIRIDANGDGTWEFDKAMTPPACAADCGTTIWSGALGSDSKIVIFSYDIRKDFNTTFIFDKNNTSPSSIQITSTVSPTTACNTATGAIALNISGGIAPYTNTWAGATPVTNNAISALNLLSGVYKVVVRDGSGCRDSAQILVSQTNLIIANAGRDTAFCAGGTAILRGGATGGTGASVYEWTTLAGQFISNQANISVTPSLSTNYVIKATDASGCFKTDTVFVKVNDAPYLTMSISTKDTICNNDAPIFKVKGAQNYTWNTFPPIANSALSSQTGDNVTLFALFLAAPVYNIIATGTDANGCVNTVQTSIAVIPLPIATVDPVMDTLCSNGAPRTLTFSPTSGNRLDARIQATNITCINCIIGDKFYPTTSGVGKFTIYNEVLNAAGCKSNPAIEINVKSCNTCLKTDTTNMVGLTCNPLAVGQVKNTLKNAIGCDSIVIITFILANSDTVKLNLTTCDSTKKGVKTIPLKNLYGCDSIVVTTTIWLKSDTTRLVSTSCNPIDTGMTQRILQNTKGCDSIIISKVTLSTKDSTTINQVTCIASQAGENTIFLKNRYGCDSVVKTIIKILKKDTTYSLSTSCLVRDTGIFIKKILNSVGCDSFHIAKISLSNGDTTRLTAKTCDVNQVGQTTVQRLRKVSGCDSLVYTTLVLNRRDSITFNRTICLGDSLRFGALWYKNQGIYAIKGLNTEGCDSVVILQLTLSKKDTTLINRTSCNRIAMGQTVERFKNVGGCDSIVITRTTFASSSMSFRINILKPISCAGKNDGQIELEMLNGIKTPFLPRWITTDTGFTLKNIRAGLYSVTVTDAEGCQAFDTFRLTDPTPLSIEATVTSPKCFEDKYGSVRINTIKGGSAPYKIFASSRLNTLDSLPFLITDLESGNQNFLISDKYNCSSDTVLQIRAGRKLSINLDKTAQLDLGDSIILSARPSYFLKTAKWTPPEGLSCDTCLPTLATPLVSKVYKLKIFDTEGCQVTESISLLVDKKRRIFAPNLFSPNGDGENEIFTLFTDASVARVKTMKIFNRWGNLLFESFDFTSGDESKGWNGTFNGVPLAADVYIFLAEIEYKDGKKEIFKGDVTLMK